MKKLLTALTCLFLCLCFADLPARAEIEKNESLDFAFTMLEKGNIFLARYNELTGSDIDVWFENGLPYYYGGFSETVLFSVYPKMRKKKNEHQTVWYEPNTVYLYGFDCRGFANWICEKTGREKLDSLNNLVLSYGKYGDNYVFTSNSHFDRKMPPWEELAGQLEIGDFYVIRHGSYHIMMFIGTLRDYGFTAEEVPELADYLDYPLVIHSGPSPVYAPRYEPYLAADPEYYRNTRLMDGGVQVSILGVPPEAVPFHVDFQKQHADYFLIGDQLMTVIRQDNVTSYCWYRPKEVRP